MKITLLTNEYPPHVYGGAGVHIEYLSQELSKIEPQNNEIQILCFGEQQIKKGSLTANGIPKKLDQTTFDPRHEKFLSTLIKDIYMCAEIDKSDIIHCHTWYSHFAGLLAKQLFNAPLVLTTHSLEPHRPWKAEQLGSAYQGSSWIEKTAYQNADGVIAVSQSMKKDVISLYGVDPSKVEVIHNGIDLNEYQPTFNAEILKKYHINPEIPFILFVGRITRQKGIIHLVNAIKHIKSGVQVVLCAGAPDTEEIEKQMQELVNLARKESKNSIIWIREMLPKNEIITLYSHAEIFICPSVYEPFGIINLEAMACETPVIASKVGGIPEIILNGENGFLIEFDTVSEKNFEPKNPQNFSIKIADKINTLIFNSKQRNQFKINARKHVEKNFSWEQITQITYHFYQKLINKTGTQN